MIDCNFFKNGSGLWECANCHYVFSRRAGRPPRRNCTNRSNIRSAASNIGAGTELKKLLHKLKINPESNCLCNQRAIVMDREGCDWCEQNIETIVTWLQQEAHKRKLPFIRSAGRLLVKRAIKNARRKYKQP